jgi:membrane fusion protein, heavy metal efflux system
VNIGEHVRKGDPLLGLLSIDLAVAKSSYEAGVSQWVHDKKVLDYKTPLAAANNISHKELIEVENDEAQSRLKMKLAKDKLLIYGLTEAEIETAKNQDGVQKARMSLRSSADGVVVNRDVVPGNYYTTQDTLLVIAARDALIIRASVDSRHAGKLEVGQRVTLRVPFVDRIIVSKVEAINWEAEPETGMVSIRTMIGNPDHRLKAGMLVRLGVDIGRKAQATKFAGGSPQEKPHLSLEERLNEVEHKLERLLDQRGGPSPTAEILGRLNELERKLDRALNRGTEK